MKMIDKKNSTQANIARPNDQLILPSEIRKKRKCFKNIQNSLKQECIPVGCVPSAAVTVSRGGGVSALGGVCSGGCLFLGGVCSGGGCLLLGVSALGGGCLLLVGGGIPACTEADTSPVDRQTPVKNITFATSLRTVKILITA